MVENSRASVQHQQKDREAKQMGESMDVLSSEKEQLETALYEAHQLLGMQTMPSTANSHRQPYAIQRSSNPITISDKCCLS